MSVIIIGAGPYGLSIAANLRVQNIPFRIFGQPMAMWADQMPRGMVLKSDGFATNFGNMPLTLEAFCHNTGRPYAHVRHRVPIADLISYGHAFQNEYVGPVEDVRVETILPHPHGFIVRLNTGEDAFAERVILATGLMGLQHMPRIANLPNAQLTHASAHNDLSRFAGQRVVVIGGGQSACETAALLHEQGAANVTILSRRPTPWFSPERPLDTAWHRLAWKRLRHPTFGIGPGWRTYLLSETPNLWHHFPEPVRLAKAYSSFGPAGSAWLKHRVVNVPGIDINIGTIAYADDNALRVTDADGSYWLPADHVIAATGYKADLRKVGFLTPLFRHIKMANGIPMLNRRFETTVPGLHIAGYLSAGSWGPSMRFIYGTNFAAPHIASHLAIGTTQVQVRYAA